MSADVPRRLPPTQGERVRNIDRGHASLSARGRTASARPVPQQGGTAQTYRPPATNNVVTGQSGTWSVAIESTITGGPGEAWATGDESVAVGRLAQAYGSNSVAIGASEATADAFGGVAIGTNALAGGSGSVAIGNAGTVGAKALGVGAIAIGGNAAANGANSVAIGTNATAGDNEFVLGRDTHFVIIRGALCLADSSGNLHRLVVSTGGALSTVAYP